MNQARRAGGVPHQRRLWAVARAFAAAVCIALAAALAVALGAADAVAAPAKDGLAVAWLVEREGADDAAAVAALPESAWTPAPGASLNVGYVGDAYWFRLRLGPDSPASRLRIDNPLLEHIRVEVVAGPGQGRRFELGTAHPFADRPLPGTALRVPLEASAQQPSELLVRVQTRTSMQVKFTLETAAMAEADERQLMLVNGVFIGIMLAMAIYNACLMISTRDRTYFWYVGWVILFGLFSAALVGAAYEWLWPHSPAWNAASRPVLLSLATSAAMLFARDFLGARSLPPAMSGGFVAVALIGLAWAGAALLFLSYQVAILGAIVLAIVAMLLAPAAAWSAWRGGSPAAGPYLAAFAFVIGAGFVLAANKFGLLPSSVWTEHATQVGAAVESMLLSFALAARLNEERRLREAAQRAAEYSRAEAGRLADLSRRDGLTGLYNRRHLESWFDLMSAGGGAMPGPVALMMVDIDHFKRLNDSFGHAVGDACIRAVAQRLQQHARRAPDIAARYGGEEFCLALPGTGAEAAEAVAESLREAVAALRVEHLGQALAVTVSIGVACCDAPMCREPRRALECADAALYEAKAAGRNRVVLRRVD